MKFQKKGWNQSEELSEDGEILCLGPNYKRNSSIKNEYFLLFKLFQPFGIFLWSLIDSEKEENYHGLDNRIGTHTIIPNWTIRTSSNSSKTQQPS